MKRPSEKLLREMSYKELSKESEWHIAESEQFLEEAEELRAKALNLSEEEAEEVLQMAVAKDAEAEAHIHHSNLLNSLMYSRIAARDKENSPSAATTKLRAA
jgi:hypothetical protein